MFIFILSSHHSKSFAVFNCLSKFLQHLLLALIFWEQKLIEASVGYRKLFFILSFNSDNKFNIFKSSYWSSIRSSSECKKLLSLIIIKVIEYDIPEPLYKWMFRVKWTNVLGYFLKLTEVKVLASTNELFKLFWRIDILEHFLIKQPEESLLKWLDLNCTLLFKKMLNEKAYEFLSILFWYKYIFSTWLQFFSYFLTENFTIIGECSLENIFQRFFLVIVQNEFETFSNIWLPHFKVIKVWSCSKQKFITCWHNWDINNNLIWGSKTKKRTNKLKFQWIFKCFAIEPVESIVWIISEHSPVRIEELLKYKLEIFFFNTSLVNSWFILKYDSQWLPDFSSWDFPCRKIVKTILQYVLSSNLYGEMNLLNNWVDSKIWIATKQIIEKGLSDVLMSIHIWNDFE